VASQDWPEVTKYAGLVSAQAHRQELIEDLYKVWQDPQRGTVSGGMIRCTAHYFNFSFLKNERNMQRFSDTFFNLSFFNGK